METLQLMSNRNVRQKQRWAANDPYTRLRSSSQTWDTIVNSEDGCRARGRGAGWAIPSTCWSCLPDP